MAISTSQIVDVGAVSVAGAAFIGWLPPVAAGLSIVWLTMQIIINFSKLIETIKGWFKVIKSLRRK